MNLLTDKLPETVQIGEKTYLVDTDFRKWILFSQMAFSVEHDAVSYARMITLVFKECPPVCEETIYALLDFYNPNKEDAARRGNSSRNKQNYDFEYDAKHIYASFLQQYGIDLTTASLHWWAFKALFDGLSEDTAFGKVLQYRCADVSKMKDKEMKSFYVKMQRHYTLPDKRTEEEKERDFADNISSVF